MKRLLLILLLLPVFVTQNANAQGWQWALGVGSSGNTLGSSTITDGSGNVYVTGTCDTANTAFGSITLHGNSLFLTKYDPNGNVIWCKGASGGWTTSVTTDHYGNVYIAGAFSDSIMTIGTATLVNTGYAPPMMVFFTFLAKYDSAGNFIWARSVGNNFTDIAYSATTDIGGNVYQWRKNWYSYKFKAIHLLDCIHYMHLN